MELIAALHRRVALPGDKSDFLFVGSGWGSGCGYWSIVPFPLQSAALAREGGDFIPHLLQFGLCFFALPGQLFELFAVLLVFGREVGRDFVPVPERFRPLAQKFVRRLLVGVALLRECLLFRRPLPGRPLLGHHLELLLMRFLQFGDAAQNGIAFLGRDSKGGADFLEFAGVIVPHSGQFLQGLVPAAHQQFNFADQRVRLLAPVLVQRIESRDGLLAHADGPFQFSAKRSNEGGIPGFRWDALEDAVRRISRSRRHDRKS